MGTGVHLGTVGRSVYSHDDKPVLDSYTDSMPSEDVIQKLVRVWWETTVVSPWNLNHKRAESVRENQGFPWQDVGVEWVPAAEALSCVHFVSMLQWKRPQHQLTDSSSDLRKRIIMRTRTWQVQRENEEIPREVKTYKENLIDPRNSWPFKMGILPNQQKG